VGEGTGLLKTEVQIVQLAKEAQGVLLSYEVNGEWIRSYYELYMLEGTTLKLSWSDGITMGPFWAELNTWPIERGRNFSWAYRVNPITWGSHGAGSLDWTDVDSYIRYQCYQWNAAKKSAVKDPQRALYVLVVARGDKFSELEKLGKELEKCIVDLEIFKAALYKGLGSSGFILGRTLFDKTSAKTLNDKARKCPKSPSTRKMKVHKIKCN